MGRGDLGGARPLQPSSTLGPLAMGIVMVRRYLYDLIKEAGLYVTRVGVLHKVNEVDLKSRTIKVVTNCGLVIRVKNSKRGRVARWLRNKWYTRARACRKCRNLKVKYSSWEVRS